MSSSALPSLSDGSTSPLLSESIDTDMAVGIETNNLLENDGIGNLVIPSFAVASNSQSRSIYQCLFHALNCEEAFDTVEEWKTHVLSHFRALPPPLSARCQLCQYKVSDARQGEAWNTMLNHMAHRHFECGQTLASSRFDIELMQFLYRAKVISEDQYKAVQLPPPPSSPAYHQLQDSVRASIGSSDEPFCVQYSPRREHRMRQRRRGITVA
jgi:hypothetical protein